MITAAFGNAFPVLIPYFIKNDFVIIILMECMIFFTITETYNEHYPQKNLPTGENQNPKKNKNVALLIV